MSPPEFSNNRCRAKVSNPRICHLAQYYDGDTVCAITCLVRRDAFVLWRTST